MNDQVTSYYANYTATGDILVLAMCVLFIVLIHTAYIKRTKNFIYLRAMIVMVIIASLSDIFFHLFMNGMGKSPNILIYIFRIVFHMCLAGNLWMYVIYLKEPLHLEYRENKKYVLISAALFILIGLFEILGTVFRFGFYIDEAGSARSVFPVFFVGYVCFLAIIMYLVYQYRDRIFRPILIGVLATVGISIWLIIIQQIHSQSSFTTATFIFPIYAILYLVHSNPYDIESGALGKDAFLDKIRTCYEKNRDLLLMSLYLPDFDKGDGGFPPEIASSIRYFVVYFFRGATLFKLTSGHIVLVVDIQRNPDYQYLSNKMIDEFNKVYPIYNRNYKIVIMETWDKVSQNNDYEGLIRYIHSRMPENSIRRVEVRDIKEYLDTVFIRDQLADIANKRNLKDERVLVFCQPVYNIHTGCYDTAEALMRLDLPELGIVYPDKFIPVAEQNNDIQILTKIILSKTCAQIRKIMDEGYIIKRISVNFSVLDMRENDFCAVVQKIIRESGISYDSIAIEITETQSEKDFKLIKKRVNDLKGSGIKFYLDDFGTGYSNFERIMEIPFDIIKFDRSLVIGAAGDDKLKSMMTHLAKMFADMDYDVLYEGVENEADETRCIDMSANYLQGYKYSKPIPIEQLKEYLQKKTEAGVE
ncbi:MAG: EAL domain-containing protein [Lachnospiraceae bacterium]|nr:EAL domain-containing protein [Lachnospiraceae bacterium]